MKLSDIPVGTRQTLALAILFAMPGSSIAQVVDQSVYVNGFEAIAISVDAKNTGSAPLLIPRATIDLAIPEELRVLFPAGEDPLAELSPKSCDLRNEESLYSEGSVVGSSIVVSTFNSIGDVTRELTDGDADGSIDATLEADYDQFSNITEQRNDLDADGQVDSKNIFEWVYSAIPSDPPGTIESVTAVFDPQTSASGEEFAILVNYFRSPSTGLMQSEEWGRSAPGSTSSFIPFAVASYEYDSAANLSRYKLDIINPAVPDLYYDFVWDDLNRLERFEVSFRLQNGTLLQGSQREYRYQADGDLDMVLIDPDAKVDQYGGNSYSYDFTASYRRTGLGNVNQIKTVPIHNAVPGLCSTVEEFTWTTGASPLVYTRDDGTVDDCNQLDAIPEQVNSYSGACVQ